MPMCVATCPLWSVACHLLSMMNCWAGQRDVSRQGDCCGSYTAALHVLCRWQFLQDSQSLLCACSTGLEWRICLRGRWPGPSSLSCNLPAAAARSSEKTFGTVAKTGPMAGMAARDYP